jgi:DNA mismatch endonuclease (patch repair protein)
VSASVPLPLDAATRGRLQRQRRRDTKPELVIRSLLHKRGFRFRVDRAPLRGHRFRADIVFGPAKVAVFVDGCFWHHCPEHGSLPKNNREWWDAKLLANQERDRRADDALRSHGWLSMRFWEHEMAEDVADEVALEVRARRKPAHDVELNGHGLRIRQTRSCPTA